MIVSTTDLQRRASMRGLQSTMKLAKQVADHLSRLDLSAAPADQLQSNAGIVLRELEDVPPDAGDDVAVEISKSGAKAWLVALHLYQHQVERVAEAALRYGIHPESGDLSAQLDILAMELQGQMELPLRGLSEKEVEIPVGAE